MLDLGLILFDMDGTLVDSMGLHADAFSQALDEQFTLPRATSRAVYVRTAGRPLDDQFSYTLEHIAGVRGQDTAPLVARFWELIEHAEPPLFPDVAAVIGRLAQAGYTLIITSGSDSRTVRRHMAHHGLAGHFKLLLGTDRGQPEMVKGPGHFAIVKRALGLDDRALARGALLVGDAPQAGSVCITAQSICSPRLNT